MIEVAIGEVVAGLFATITSVTWASLHYVTKINKQNEPPPPPPPKENPILTMLVLEKDDLMFKMSQSCYAARRDEFMTRLRAVVKEITEIEAAQNER